MALFVLGYGIFRNFGIWDIGIYFGIRVNYFWDMGYFGRFIFGIWDIAYPPNQGKRDTLKTVLKTRYGVGPLEAKQMIFPINKQELVC